MNTNQRHILICGASIAGPCLAYWLNRAGFKTTIIERAPKFRDGGQNIDIKGHGQTIVEKMGLIDQVKARTTRELGLRFVDRAGRTFAEFPKDGELSITQEIEIRRGDLARVFYEATNEKTTYKFGVTIKSLVDQSDSVRVEFNDGTTENFDVVVSAEGVGSATRKLVMGESVKFKYLGLWMAFFQIPKARTDDNWARWYNAVGGHVILMRPSTTESESVCVDFRSENPNVDYQPIEAQRKTIQKVLHGMGWESDRIAQNLKYDDDLYMGPLSQVKAARWSKGRFALLGDAGYAPSPLTGMGTSLAITGAYVLAGELAKNEDVIAALKSYERILRQFVENAQKLPPGVPAVAHPKTKMGIWTLNTAARLAASPFIQRALRVLKPKTGDKSADAQQDGFTLPTYDWA